MSWLDSRLFKNYRLLLESCWEKAEIWSHIFQRWDEAWKWKINWPKRKHVMMESWLQKRKNQWRKPVVGSLLEEKPLIPLWGGEVTASSSWASGPEVWVPPRCLGAVMINSQLGCPAYVWLHMASDENRMLGSLLPFWKFSSRNMVTLFTTTTSFQRSTFRKMQRAGECLTKPIWFQKPVSSQTCHFH